MFKNKQAQGLTLNTIVIAAIVMVVLVVLILVFSDQISDFVSGLRDVKEKTCTEAGGIELISDECNEQIYGYIIETPGYVCCKQIS